MTEPSIGVRRSRTGPLPRHSPQKTPGLTGSMPRFSSQAGGFIGHFLYGRLRLKSILAHAPALLLKSLQRLPNGLGRKLERGPEADRAFAGADSEQAEIVKAVVKFFAALAIRQIEGQHQAASAHRRYERFGVSEFAQTLQEFLAHSRGVADQVVTLDDPQVMRGQGTP